jgi:N4-gp56 family major capsid protein
MATQIPYGSALARKVYGAALFAAVQIEPGFMNLLTGPAPKQADAEAKLKGQTSAEYPIVRVTDLSKGAGASVSVDLFNNLTGKPTMGDKRIAGKLMSLTYSSMDVQINQYRGGADAGGKMTQQRTVWNLRGIAMAGLTNWAGRLEDQLCLVAMAGARGTQDTADWVVPKATDPDFTSIMVNTVNAPTKNRQFYANDATAITNLDTTDILTLTDFDRIASVLKDSQIPLQSVKIKGDVYAWNDPLWVTFVTNRQWLYLQTRTGEKGWRAFLQNAYERRSAGMRHPLFYGDVGMWAGILIRPMNRLAIRFAAGDTVAYDTGGSNGKTFTTANATAAVATDRAIIVGAQALLKCYGQHQSSEYYYSWHEEEVDHGNAVETSCAMMGGVAKTRFSVYDGVANVDTDYGVAVLDSYAPDPQSAAGKALLV